MDSLAAYLADETALSESEATDKAENGGTVARNSTAREAADLKRTIEVEFGVECSVTWVGTDGTEKSVVQFNRVKGAITGGAPPADATVAVANGDGPPLVAGDVFRDETYDLVYPEIDTESFELVVRLRNSNGEKITESLSVTHPDRVEIVDIEITFGDAQQITEGEDLLDFMVIKPREAAAAEATETLSTAGTVAQPLMARLEEAKSEGDREAMTDAAAEFRASEQYVEDPSELSVPLSDFKRAAERANSLSDLQNAIEEMFGSPATSVTDTASFADARERVASSLTAASLDSEPQQETVGRLEDAMRLFSLVERAAAEDEQLDRMGAVGRALDRPITLSDSLFPLPQNRIQAQADPATENGTQTEQLAETLTTVKRARNELVSTAFGPGAAAGADVSAISFSQNVAVDTTEGPSSEAGGEQRFQATQSQSDDWDGEREATPDDRDEGTDTTDVKRDEERDDHDIGDHLAEAVEDATEILDDADEHEEGDEEDALDDDFDDETDDEDDDDGVVGDGGSATMQPLRLGNLLGESTMETLGSVGLDDPNLSPDDALSVLETKTREVGADMQYELLDGVTTSAPHSPMSLLGESVGIMEEASDGVFEWIGPEAFYPVEPHVNPLGIAELQTMRKTLDRYEMGEIAHIENVLEGELRDRKHRTLERTEEYVGKETERVKEKKKSLQSTSASRWKTRRARPSSKSGKSIRASRFLPLTARRSK
nr:hypothetical protein DEQ67_15380 [Haloferax sp. Atlit-48N]